MAAAGKNNEIVVSRILNAPRELVWKAWTDPKHVANWWGPRGFTTTTEIMDVRVGGKWVHVMHGPDGANYPNRSVFTEVIPYERICYTHDGHREGGPDVHFDSTWTFVERGKNKTELTVRMVFESAEACERTAKNFGAIEGAHQTLERLSELLLQTYGGKKLSVTLPSSREILLTRSFQAPASLVFKAFLDAESIPKWWGPRGYETTVEKLEARAGGKWRITQRDPEGRTHAFRGEFREITPNSKIVRTFEYEPWAGRGSLETVNFEERGGITTVLILSRFENETDRNQMIEGGMEYGANQAFERLEETLAEKSGELTITRTFDAPRELVFDAWTRPEHLVRWMGPKGCESNYKICDISEGGMSMFFMKAPNGFQMWGKVFYREVTRPTRLVYVQYFADESGAIARHPMNPDWPREMLTTVEFKDEGEKTKITLRWTPITTSEAEKAAFEQGRKGATMGWGGSFEVLDELLIRLKA